MVVNGLRANLVLKKIKHLDVKYCLFELNAENPLLFTTYKPCLGITIIQKYDGFSFHP